MKKWLIVLLAGLLVFSIITPSVAQSVVEPKYNMSYVYFGHPNTYTQQVDRTNHSLNTVSPGYFDIASDGTLQMSWSFSESFITDMHERGIKVTPFLSNHWDRSRGEAALRSPDSRELLASQLAEVIQKYNMDGINVDIENVTHLYRDAYTDLVQRLRSKLPEDKIVSVAVAANPNNFTLGWHGSYDYAALAEHADYLLIMAYDESYPGSAEGPVASIQFVERSIQYALQHAPAEKIVLGVPFYGRIWKDDNSIRGIGITNKRTTELVQQFNGEVVFDEHVKEARATFTIPEGQTAQNGTSTLTAGNYAVWFSNEESLKQKLSLVTKYDIKGAGSWALNQEADGTWDYFSTYLNGGPMVVNEPVSEEEGVEEEAPEEVVEEIVSEEKTKEEEQKNNNRGNRNGHKKNDNNDSDNNNTSTLENGNNGNGNGNGNGRNNR